MKRSKEDESAIPDSELIRRCAEGELYAQELLYKRYFSFAMTVCVRYTRDQSEAIGFVNDSFMKVLDRIQDLDSSRPFRPWYSAILVNTAIDNYRRNAKHVSHVQLSDLELTEFQAVQVTSDLSADEILFLFSLLPDNYRITFNLYEIEGYSHEEIGHMLHISTSTSRSNLARAKKLLRELYNRYFNPEQEK